MRQRGLKVLAIMAAGAMLSAAGCCAQQEQTIKELTREYNDLSKQHEDLRAQFNATQARNAELDAQLQQTESELGQTKTELAAANEKLAARGGQTSETGWEKGLTADKITVGSDILFASGKADLTTAGKQQLDKIADALKTTYAGMPVRVYGYTDSDPIKQTKELWDDNLDLSANRAMAVTRYLISKGIEADRVETIGMGMTHPVASNATAAGKTKNRRVEIIVMKS